MDTLKMVAEIKNTCEKLETKKADLIARVKQIDDDLAAYHMAIESLEMTVRQTVYVAQEAEPEVKPEPVKLNHGPRKDAELLEFNGEKKTYQEWSEIYGINRCTIIYRIKHGWSAEDALTKPANTKMHPKKKQPKSHKVFMYDSHGNIIRQYVGTGDAARDLNLPATTIEKIIAKMSKDDQLRVRNYYLAYAG